MKLRWCLPPLAALSLAGVVWIVTRGRAFSPEQLLESARSKLESEPPDRSGARRELDEGLGLALGPEHAEVRAMLLDVRSQVYEDARLFELALADCQARLEEWGASTDVLARASDLCLHLGEPSLALEHAEHLAALDPVRGQCRVGRARVALADLPLAALQRLAKSTLLPSQATRATLLAQRAAVFADDEDESSAALEELLELFPRAEDGRRSREWVQEAAENLRSARGAFVASLAPGSTGEAAAGMQDLLLRGGSEREAADLGGVALSIPDLARPMPVLARTAAALVALGEHAEARALILDLKKRDKEVLQPDDLPSYALRDELEEWCLLLETLEMWDELRPAAKLFSERTQTGSDVGKNALAWLLYATAELHLGQHAAAQRILDFIGTGPFGGRELGMRVWKTRAELARRVGERAPERYALMFLTRTAPADPSPPLRAEIGGVWQRLSELQKEEGDLQNAEISLTHALRCSSERANEVEPLWDEIGHKSLATGGASSPYILYARAKNLVDQGEPEEALTDARTLLEAYPGLGPALEVVSRAADKLNDYPLLISASLELMERGWPAGGASARLRTVPGEYFLPQDRVRWLLLDPRGSLQPVMQALLAKGDLAGAALAACGGPARAQPPELLPFLARVAFDAGEPGPALEMLEVLPFGSAQFRSCTGLALNAALHRFSRGRPAELARVVANVVATGRAEDRELPAALDALLACGRTSEAQALLAWLAPQAPPFLGEVLLRQTVARALARGSAPVDEDLERAAALLDDGRPELGRLVLALEEGDDAALEREARAALDTPLARPAARRAALLLLAGAPATAAAQLEGLRPDGREFLLELVQACLATLAPEVLEGSASAPLSSFLLEAVPARKLLLFGIATEVSPWNAWAVADIHALDAPFQDDPWMRGLEARAWLSLAWPGKAQAALARASAADEPDARLAWLRTRAERAAGANAEAVLAADLDWFAASGLSASEDPTLAPLAARLAARRDTRDEAVRTLEAALEARPADPDLRLALAELENTKGRRTRALELYDLVLAGRPGHLGDAQALAYLDALRVARDEGEISAERWWAEVESLEAERPEDPAPVRELATRAFEQGGPGTSGRADALERLARFRARTLDRSLESLRSGEGARWIQLLARYTPERAVTFAEEELQRDPSEPGLWRASAEALLAARRPQAALERLEALQRVAPAHETTRLLALTSLQVESDPERFAERLEAMKRFDRRSEEDAVLSFYAGILAPRGQGKTEGIQEALELWRARAGNGLSEPEHGRKLALGLFYAGRRALALAALGDTYQVAESALEKDVLLAFSYLMRNAPAEPRRIEDAPAPPPPAPAPSADDAPAKQGGAPASGASDAEAKRKAGAASKERPAEPRAKSPAKEPK